MATVPSRQRRAWIAVSGVVLALVAALLGWLPSEAQAARPANGLLAYGLVQPEETCDQCSNGDSVTSAERGWVETIRPDGTHRRRLTCTTKPASSCNDGSPLFSYDGRRLAVFGSGGLLIRDLAGRRLLRLRSVTTQAAAWSPDGRRFAFTDYLSPEEAPESEDEKLGVRVVGLAGRTRLLSRQDSSAVSWSPTGKVAWDTSHEGLPSGDVWVANADGTGRRRLLRKAGWPRWSYSGRRIAFICRAGLCVANSNGTRRRVLTRACAFYSTEIPVSVGFAWSPDGRYIACLTKRGSLITENVRTHALRMVRRGNDLTDAYIADIDWQRRRSK